VAEHRRDDAATLVLFLGSNIGNLDPPADEEFLSSIRETLRRGDGLLLGTDLVKPEPDLLLAYDDPLGVTAAFNKNLLVRINRELGGLFELGAFEHRAIWNGEARRVEMHLVSTRDQNVRIPGARCTVSLRQNESIWTESSYKYEPHRVLARRLHTVGAVGRSRGSLRPDALRSRAEGRRRFSFTVQLSPLREAFAREPLLL
jgi:uncharacterized SAM-dependent methyltransferase